MENHLLNPNPNSTAIVVLLWANDAGWPSCPWIFVCEKPCTPGPSSPKISNMNIVVAETPAKHLEKELRGFGFSQLSVVPISKIGNLRITRPGVRHLIIVGDRYSEAELQFLGFKYGILRMNNYSIGQAEIFKEYEVNVIQDVWLRNGAVLGALANLRFANKSMECHDPTLSSSIGHFLRTNFPMEEIPELKFRWFSEFLGWELCDEILPGRRNQLVLNDKERSLLAALNPEWDNPPNAFSESIETIRKDPVVQRAYSAVVSFELIISRSLRRNHPLPEPSLRSHWIQRLELQDAKYGIQQ